jgi:DNA-binding NarL/FixJ family response regulator
MVDQQGNPQKNNTGGGIRVLIVDDVTQVRQELKTVLSLATKNSLHIDVIGEAKNGNEAIVQSEMLNPDVVLMDLEMPGGDGLAASHSIKTSHPTIGVIVLTIHSDDHTRQKAALAGVDAFIEKGSPISELLQAIYRHTRAA